MLSLAFYFVLLFLTILFMIQTYCEFRTTRDSAYAIFFTVAAVLIMFMTWGFLHFKPWLFN